MKHKLFTLFLALASVGTMFADKVQIGELYYNLNAANQTAEVTSENDKNPRWSTNISVANIPSIVTYDKVKYSVSSIGKDAFYECKSLTSVTVPNSVTSIGDRAFYGCTGLISASIPNSVTSIGECAFSFCDVLSSVTIPMSVKSIGWGGFAFSTGLTSITCEAYIPPTCGLELGFGVFDDVDKSIPLYVPSKSVDAYKAADQWKEFTNIQPMKEDPAPCIIASGSCGAEGDNLAWKLSCDGVLSISGTGAMKDYSYTDSPWFAQRISITSLIINNSVTGIGEYAFFCCSELSSVTIPNSVTSIKQGAFYGCSGLTSIEIPNSVITIDWSVFQGCTGLTSVTIPSSVTSIELGTFYECTGLTSIDIPGSVISIGQYAFAYCTGLTSITCEAVTPPSLEDNVFVKVNKSIPLYVPAESIALYRDADQWKDFTNIQPIKGEDPTPCITASGTCGAEGDNLAWELSCEGVLSISGTGAMTDYSNAKNVPWYSERKNITTLVISDGVTSIGDYTFYGCNMTSVTIPNGVTKIGAWALSNCLVLSSVTIPSSVTSIGSHAFSACSALTSIEIPNGVTSIGSYAFSSCGVLASIAIPSSVTSIGERAFCYCPGISSIIVDKENTTYDSRNDCNAIIETSTNKLLAGCQNTIIPDGVACIGYGAFQQCTGLTSITIPGSVTSILDGAFYDCEGLTSITCKAVTPPSLGSKIFPGVDTSIPLYVPAESIDAYQKADQWKDFTNIQPIKGEDPTPCITASGTCGEKVTWELSCDGVLTISGTGAMTDYKSIKDAPWYSERKNLIVLIISNGVTNVGNYAFHTCSSLTSVSIPSSVTNIGIATFEACKGLKSITIPNSVTSIGDGAFAWCSPLTSITCEAVTPPLVFGDDIFLSLDKSIPLYVPAESIELYQAADQWKKFTNIQPINEDPAPCITASGTCGAEGDNLTWELSCEGVLTISGTGEMADYSPEASPWFAQRLSIITAIISDGITSIGDFAFHDCSEMTSVTITNSVTSIGKSAFESCYSLASIEIPNSVTSLGTWAFGACKGLTSIVVESGNPKYDSRNNCNAIIETASNKLVWGCRNTIIPDGVTSIGEWAFAYCSVLTSTDIPNSVTTIEDNAFFQCTGLTSITCKAVAPPSLGKEVFYGVDKSIPLYVPAESIELYHKADQWKDFKNIQPIEVPAPCLFGSGTCGKEGDNLTWELDCDGVLTISGTGAMMDYISSDKVPWFINRSLIASVTINADVTSIGDEVFSGCTELSSVTIPNSVTRIGEGAFYNCSNLTAIEIPNSVTSIGSYAFYGCKGLNSITIPNGVISIGDNTFNACTGLISMLVESGNTKYDSRENCNAIIETASNKLVFGCQNTTIPNSVTGIGNNAFWGCVGLISITIPNSVTYIEKSAFSDCSALKSVVIPNSITSIGEGVFSLCSSLTSVTIPNSVTSIKSYAFYSCTGLTSITCEAVAPPTLSFYVFEEVDKSIPLYVPAESIEAYQKAEQWKDFTNIQPIKVPEPIETIEEDVNVKYVDNDEAELYTELLTFNVPIAPIIEGFTFIGWKVREGLLEEGITIQAIYKSDTPTSAPAVYTNPSNPAQKLIRNGNVYILTDDSRTYTITGQQVK